MKNGILVLIVARPGPLRDGLRALLTAIPQIDRIVQADDMPAALDVIAEHRPALVLVDCIPRSDEWCTAVRRVKVESPQTRTIALAEDVQQQQAAQAMADVVLLKGAPAAELYATLERLLPQTG